MKIGDSVVVIQKKLFKKVNLNGKLLNKELKTNESWLGMIEEFEEYTIQLDNNKIIKFDTNNTVYSIVT